MYIEIWKKYFNYLQELFDFIFTPEKYFDIILKESKAETFIRLIVYAIQFYIIITIILLGKKAENIQEIVFNCSHFGIGDLENRLLIPIIALSISSYCSNKIFKTKVPLKKVIVFILTFHFSITVIIWLFYSIFIIAENYIYVIYVAIITVFINIYLFHRRVYYLSNKKNWTFLILYLISYVILASINIQIANLVNFNYDASEFAFIHDPIGEEFIKINTQIEKYYDAQLISLSHLKNQKNISLYKGYKNMLIKYNSYLKNTIPKVKYNTTKDLLNEEIKSLDIQIRAIELYCPEHCDNISSYLINMYKKHNNKANKYKEKLMWLKKYHLITYNK